LLGGSNKRVWGKDSPMLRGSQAGIIGRHRGLAPYGSEAREIPPHLHQVL
jgi:hypothetical protein